MTPQTNVSTEALRTLHRIHRQLNDLKDRLGRGPRLIRAHQANLEKREAELAEVSAEALQLRMDNDAKQLQLASREATIEKRRLQLGQADENREYQALKDQIAAHKAASDVLEVEILEGMEKLDEFDEKITQAESALAKARQDADKSRRETEQQEPLIKDDVRRLETELKNAETALPMEVREFYQRLVRSRGEDALATVEGRFCGGCNQQIPVNMINELMLSRPVVCRVCGRLLYLPENYSPQ